MNPYSDSGRTASQWDAPFSLHKSMHGMLQIVGQFLSHHGSLLQLILPSLVFDLLFDAMLLI